VAVICHARGRWSKPTCCAAGPSPHGRACAPTSPTPAGNWVDREVVTDDGLVSSRKPEDLDAFCTTLVATFKEQRPAHQRAA